MAPEKQPWYRSSVATFTAGLVGLALIAGLVMAVVQMSGRWNTTDSETVVSPGGGVPEPPHFGAKTSASPTSTSYTSVRLSTTDIGAPNLSPTSSSETSSSETTPSESPTSTTPSNAVAPTFPGTFPTRVTNPPGTARSGPRINVTRTPP